MIDEQAWYSYTQYLAIHLVGPQDRWLAERELVRAHAPASREERDAAHAYVYGTTLVALAAKSFLTDDDVLIIEAVRGELAALGWNPKASHYDAKF